VALFFVRHTALYPKKANSTVNLGEASAEVVEDVLLRAQEILD
jgi:hypothetical protein